MIYAYKKQNDLGNYVDASGMRFVLYTASRLYSDNRSCWQEYEDKETALAALGLTPYVDPNALTEEGEYYGTEE